MYRIYDTCVCYMTDQWGGRRTPYFSWKLAGAEEEQAAYRIVVKKQEGAVLWDSGEVGSGRVHNIPYGGGAERSGSRYEGALTAGEWYCWTVYSRSDQGSLAQSGETLFQAEPETHVDWKARWVEGTHRRIPCQDVTDSMRLFTGEFDRERDPETALNPPVYFRKSFRLKRMPKRAVIYATAHGIYSCFINGNKISQPFAPGYTSYRRHLEYQQYDVTENLLIGENVIGAVVADGWYLGKIGLMGIGEQYGTAAAFLFQMELVYPEGGRERILSDAEVRWRIGGYRYGDLFVGEKYDARLEPEGWKRPGYVENGWHPVQVKPYGTECLLGGIGPGIGILDSWRIKEIRTSPRGERIADAGRVMVGCLQIVMRGKQGSAVSFEYCEQLDGEGNFFCHILGQNKDQKDVYVFKDGGTVTYTPEFTYHGFRYVRICLEEGIVLEEIRALEMGSLLKQTGDFQCSHQGLNQLQKNIYNSQRGNMFSIPTDCPQRERAGWTGDMQVFAATACFNMDMEYFLGRWLYDMRLEQQEDGQIPNTVPMIPSNDLIENLASKHKCSAGWGDACVIVPYVLYREYGDKRILKDNISMMKGWMAYVEKQAAFSFPPDYPQMDTLRKKRQKYLWNTEFHFGDWLVPSLAKGGNPPHVSAEKTKELTATCMYAYSTELMAEICGELQDPQGAAYYRALNEKIKWAFAEEYLEERGILKSDYQGCYVLALKMGLIPEKWKGRYLSRLKTLLCENGKCLDTGFLSTPFLLDVLYENGERELAYEVLFQTKCPSWLHEVTCGATSIWEWWDSVDEKGCPKVSSYNHFAFGSVGDFIYRRILGITAEEPGYRRVRVQPDFTCGLTYVRGYHDCIYGRITVEWGIEEGKKWLRAQFPPGVNGRILADAKVEILPS